jgi:hypothetical protein
MMAKVTLYHDCDDPLYQIIAWRTDSECIASGFVFRDLEQAETLADRWTRLFRRSGEDPDHQPYAEVIDVEAAEVMSLGLRVLGGALR